MRVLAVGSWIIDHWHLAHNRQQKNDRNTAEVADTLNHQDRRDDLHVVDFRILFTIPTVEDVLDAKLESVKEYLLSDDGNDLTNDNGK